MTSSPSLLLFTRHVFLPPAAECVGELPSGDGLLGEDRPGDRQPRGSPERRHGGGPRVEGEAAALSCIPPMHFMARHSG